MLDFNANISALISWLILGKNSSFHNLHKSCILSLFSIGIIAANQITLCLKISVETELYHFAAILSRARLNLKNRCQGAT